MSDNPINNASHKIEQRKLYRSQLYILELEAAKKGPHIALEKLLEIEEIKDKIQNLKSKDPLTQDELSEEIYYRRSIIKMKERRLFHLEEKSKYHGVSEDNDLKLELKETKREVEELKQRLRQLEENFLKITGSTTFIEPKIVISNKINPKDAQNTRELIVAHQRRLHSLRMKAAILGLSADPSLHIEIEDIEKEIEQLEAASS